MLTYAHLASGKRGKRDVGMRDEVPNAHLVSDRRGKRDVEKRDAVLLRLPPLLRLLTTDNRRNKEKSKTEELLSCLARRLSRMSG